MRLPTQNSSHASCLWDKVPIPWEVHKALRLDPAQSPREAVPAPLTGPLPRPPNGALAPPPQPPRLLQASQSAGVTISPTFQMGKLRPAAHSPAVAKRIDPNPSPQAFPVSLF